MFQTDLNTMLQDPQWVAALAAGITAILFLLLLIVIAVQLGGLKKQVKLAVDHTRVNAEAQRRRATVEAVRRYESDPILRESIQKLWAKTAQGTDYTLLDGDDEFQVITVLNYFDGIANGIEQGVLVEGIVKDYLRVVLSKNVKALLKGQSGDTWVSDGPAAPEEGFEVLVKLYTRWGLEEKSIYDMLR
ncbi:MAG: hypothetical protein ACI8UO_005997 [Verrucomicrobiales bacterium]|jgi:hypothetical protein